MVSRSNALWIGALLACLPACVSTDEYGRKSAANSALQTQIDDLKRYQKELEDENGRLKREVDALQKRAVEAGDVEKKRRELDELLARLGQNVGDGITVRETAEGIAYDVQGELLFEPGRAELTSKGRTALGGLIASLKSAGRRIRVDGHTDTDPIKHSGWRDNLHLSAERSLSVAAFLVQSGLPADQISIAGYGEHRPKVEGASPEAKRQNRRVEILMLKNG